MYKWACVHTFGRNNAILLKLSWTLWGHRNLANSQCQLFYKGKFECFRNVTSPLPKRALKAVHGHPFNYTRLGYSGPLTFVNLSICLCIGWGFSIKFWVPLVLHLDQPVCVRRGRWLHLYSALGALQFVSYSPVHTFSHWWQWATTGPTIRSFSGLGSCSRKLWHVDWTTSPLISEGPLLFLSHRHSSKRCYNVNTTEIIHQRRPGLNM